MESEKVKETLSKEQIIEILKKRIENINPWETHALEYHKGLLDLINELESENERLNNELKKHKCDWLNSEKMHLQAEMEETEFELFCANKLLKELREENKALKDRIAELEEYIKGNANDAKAFVENWHNDLNKELTNFAERIKMEFYYEFDEIIPSIMAVKIDKILKEFIGETNE